MKFLQDDLLGKHTFTFNMSKNHIFRWKIFLGFLLGEQTWEIMLSEWWSLSGIISLGNYFILDDYLMTMWSSSCPKEKN